MDPRLEEIIKDETNSFRLETRQMYVDLMNESDYEQHIDECVFVIGSSPAKKYASIILAALKKHGVVLLAAKGGLTSKLVAIAEIIKHSDVDVQKQLNRISLTDLLVNPEFRPEASTKNVKAFIAQSQETPQEVGDSIIGVPAADGKPRSEKSILSDVVKLIHGPKIYDVPTMTIVLCTNDHLIRNDFFTEQR